MVADTGRFLRL